MAAPDMTGDGVLVVGCHAPHLPDGKMCVYMLLVHHGLHSSGHQHSPTRLAMDRGLHLFTVSLIIPRLAILYLFDSVH